MKIYFSEDWHLQAKYRIAAYLVSPDLWTVNFYKHSRNPSFHDIDIFTATIMNVRRNELVSYSKRSVSQTQALVLLTTRWECCSQQLNALQVQYTVYSTTNTLHFHFHSMFLYLRLIKCQKSVSSYHNFKLDKTSLTLVSFVKEIFSGYLFYQKYIENKQAYIFPWTTIFSGN